MKVDSIEFKVFMALHGLNGDDVIAMTGLSRGTISNIRSGKSCSSKTGEALLRLMNMSSESIAELKEARVCNQKS